MKEELKVKELNAIEKLFNIRICDEDDVNDLLNIIYSQNEEFRKVYNFEKLEEDFASNAAQWFVLETQAPDECLLLAARFYSGEDSRIVQVFADKQLDLLTTAKTRIMNYFILQLQTVCHNLLYSEIIIEVAASESEFLQILENYLFFDSGGYLIGSSLMVLQFKKQIATEAELLGNYLQYEEIVTEGPLQDVSEMTSLIDDLFAALHKSAEFNPDLN